MANKKLKLLYLARYLREETDERHPRTLQDMIAYLERCGISAERKSLCSVDAAALKAEAADLSARMEKGVRVVFGSKEAVEAAKELFDRVETL